MSKILWKSLLIHPAALAATLVVSSSVSAAPTSTVAEILQPEAVEAKSPEENLVVPVTYSTAKPNAVTSEQLKADAEATVAQVTVTPTQVPSATEATPAATPAVASPEAIDQVNRYSNEGKANNSIAQVTSVSQLSDVQPTDWAFQALQSLVERYGVIAGYPDGTYRGNRAMTRYEFAAGLNAALDRVNELIAAGSADLVRREDLATLQRLQEEFAAELATLRGRVDSLEAVTAELEANQFSTTTKLVGEVIAAVSDTFGNDVEDNTVFQDRIRLDLQTSFGGSDILHTRLSTGNARPFGILGADTDGDGIEEPGTFEGLQTFNLSPDGDFGNDVFIDWVAYDFPLFGNARGYLAATGGVHADYADTVNPYFEDFDGGNGSLSTFAQESPIYRIGGGAGGGVKLAFGEGGILGASSLSLGYLADNAASPGEDFGIGNGDYSALAQLNFNLGNRFAVAATYVHGYHNAGAGIYDIGATGSSSQVATSGEVTAAVPNAVVGTALANDPSALLGAGGSVPLVTNTYGIEAAFRLSDRVSISGWAAYTDVTLLGRGDGEIWTYALGVAFPDLGKEGNVLGLFAGVQPTLRGLDVPGDPAFENDYGYHVEGFYKYRLTDNISITPGVIWLTAPGQNEDNSDVVIGTLRTTFNF